MFYDKSEILSDSEIYLLKKLIENVHSDTFINYNFFEDELKAIIEEAEIINEVLDSLVVKQIIRPVISEMCNNCESDLNLCFCGETDRKEKKYYIVKEDQFIEFIIRTIEHKYDAKLESRKQIKDSLNLNFKDGEYDIKLQFYFNSLSSEFFISDILDDKILVSIMPIREVECPDNIYEWYEIITDQENVESLKRVLKRNDIKMKSKDFYYLDLGDDMEIAEIETVRDVLREYLSKLGFTNHTEPNKYRPEIVDYSIVQENVKECFIKENNKILIIKPSEKQICIAFFNKGLINTDQYLHKIICIFDAFIKNKAKKLREIKNHQEKATATEKIFQLSGPAINIIVLIMGIISKNPIFENLNEIITGKIFILIFMIINIISVTYIILYSIIPYIKFNNFSWFRGLNKILKC